MTSLIELDQELHPPEPAETGDDWDGEYEDSGNGSYTRASALAARRPIRYRVSKGTLPLIAQPGSMNAWAAVTTMLLSWRDGQALGVEEAVGRLGGQYLDVVRRNTGLPASEKAALLAAAGIVADPPAKPSAERVERLLREKGPLWMTTDEREGELFSSNAAVVVGIAGRGRPSDTKLDLVDPATGRHRTVTLSSVARKFGGPSGRVQMLYLRDGDAQQASLAGAYSYSSSRPRYAVARTGPLGPAVAIAGLTYTIVKDVLMNEGDVRWQVEKMDGLKHPFDDVSWGNRGQWQAKEFRADSWVENGLSDRVGADFIVKFRYNGHSVGDIGITNVGTNDAVGWGVDISASILPAREAYRVGGKEPVSAVELTFTYRFSRSIGSDRIRVERFVIYADGSVVENSRFTQ